MILEWFAFGGGTTVTRIESVSTPQLLLDSMKYLEVTVGLTVMLLELELKFFQTKFPLLIANN